MINASVPHFQLCVFELWSKSCGLVFLISNFPLAWVWKWAPWNLYECLMMKENESFSHKKQLWQWGIAASCIFYLYFFLCGLFSTFLPLCSSYNESRDAMKINEPVGASPSDNLKSWNNEISTKSRCTIQMQEQTKPKQNKASVFEERKTQTGWVPFNNIQSTIFSVPACYSERSSKYLERRRRDETGAEQWDFGCVMASVHLTPPTLCSVLCAVRVPCWFPTCSESRWSLSHNSPVPHTPALWNTHM